MNPRKKDILMTLLKNLNLNHSLKSVPGLSLVFTEHRLQFHSILWAQIKICFFSSFSFKKLFYSNINVKDDTDVTGWDTYKHVA